MADQQNDRHEQSGAIADVKSARGRRFLRLFLMAAGGLAAPCLALAAFFFTNTGDGGTPAAKSGLVQGGQVTTTTRRPAPVAPVATTTTTLPSSPVSPPPRDPFQPLVTQAPAGGTPAR